MNVIRVHSKTEKELAEIGRKIGEAFALEKSGIVTVLPQEHIVKTFQIMTEFYYNLGVLYTTSENEEGFIAFWLKSEKIPLRLKFHVIKRMICEVPLRSCFLIAPTGSEQFGKIYRHEKDYVAVSMLVILKEYQGKGFMRHLLKVPFSIADKNSIPCVLDTDTEIKVKKYERVGMRIAKCTRMSNGFSLYTMEYRT